MLCAGIVKKSGMNFGERGVIAGINISNSGCNKWIRFRIAYFAAFKCGDDVVMTGRVVNTLLFEGKSGDVDGEVKALIQLCWTQKIDTVIHTRLYVISVARGGFYIFVACVLLHKVCDKGKAFVSTASRG